MTISTPTAQAEMDAALACWRSSAHGYDEFLALASALAPLLDDYTLRQALATEADRDPKKSHGKEIEGVVTWVRNKQKGF